MIGEELREARLLAALTQREVALAVGISAAEVSRIERGQAPHVAYETLVAIAAVLGLDLPLRAFPNDDAVRDAGQLRLLAALRTILPHLDHRSEVALGLPGDRRAWDLMLLGPGWSLAVEAETRLRDIQALQRKITLKCRDGGLDRVLLLVADTRHNRRVLRLASDEFVASFPLRGRDALAALRAGRLPEESAIVMLRPGPSKVPSRRGFSPGDRNEQGPA
jgi:transcriptional regulator with XRE-family HTH domain